MSTFAPEVREEVEKAQARMRSNKLVPVGMLATCGALTMAAIKLRQRNSLTMNHWLRARVVLQGVTVAALMWSMYDFGRTEVKGEDGTMKGTWEVLEQESKDSKREKERRGFEERLKGAEDAHHRDQIPVTVVRQKRSFWSFW